MRKKGMFLGMVLMAGIMALPGTVYAEEKVETETEVQDPLMVTDEGYVIEGDGYQAVVTWCDNGETKLFGRMYYPEDFDENSSYTTVVMNHGKSINFIERTSAGEKP